MTKADFRKLSNPEQNATVAEIVRGIRFDVHTNALVTPIQFLKMDKSNLLPDEVDRLMKYIPSFPSNEAEAQLVAIGKLE